jgi:hypothetical protein
MNQKYLKSLVCVGGVALGFNCAGQSAFYNNFPNYNGNAFSLISGQQIGNEISLQNGTALTSFSIEYYSPNTTLAPTVGIDVTFYNQNGPVVNGFKTPGTEFFNSGYYTGGAGGLGGGYQVVTFNTTDFAAGAQNGWGGNYSLPQDFTFSVSFTGLNALNVVDMPLANITPGTSYGDYWLNNGTGWTLMYNTSSDGNLVVDMVGTVPEPSTFGLAALGGVALLGFNKLRRRS